MHINYSYNIAAKICPFLTSQEKRHVGRCFRSRCALWHDGYGCGLKNPIPEEYAHSSEYTGPELPGGQE